MNWYLAPVCTVDVESNGYHPGEADGSVCPGIVAGIVVHAYNPDPQLDLVPTTCLVGAFLPQTRLGWVSLSLEEARAHFESVVGRAPLATEVF